MGYNIIKILRKICFAFLILYGLNYILSSLNIFIPINIPTIATISFLGTPGLVSLFLVYLFIN